jgi:Photosynthesis system II assembly factor YCF48/Putative zinc-finger
VIPGPCLDAETIAAWADDSLAAGERAAVEAHAADCARCQQLLAAMVRTEPPAEPKAAWWRRGSTLGWLVPLTATAAAAVIWIVVSPGTIRPPEEAAPVAMVEEAPTPSRETTSQKPIASGNLVARSDKAVDSLSAAAPPAAPAAAAPALPPPAASAERVAVGGALHDEAFAKAERRAEPVPEIVSSNPASRWRITPTPGLIQHSADGGATWELQETHVAAELDAGASPVPSVCWLVGRAGLVLLSTDARTWRRVMFPESADLVAVQATDESTATVTTADGRKFSTSDGGLTWDREPLQETPATPF